jgi:hypothetical protein
VANAEKNGYGIDLAHRLVQQVQGTSEVGAMAPDGYCGSPRARRCHKKLAEHGMLDHATGSGPGAPIAAALG